MIPGSKLVVISSKKRTDVVPFLMLVLSVSWNSLLWVSKKR